MATLLSDPVASVEAFRARSRHVELPSCDGLRACATVTATAQFLMTTRVAEVVDLRPVVQAGFALTGFLLTTFLLRDRGAGGSKGLDGAAGEVASKTRSILASLPLFHLIGVVAAILYLPRLLTVESIATPDLAELPALIDRALKSGLADFQRASFDGRSLIAWSLAMMILPRRGLGLGFLLVLGSGLAIQFSGLLSGEVRPAEFLVAPSPLDLLALGALAAAIGRGIAGSGHDGRIARWALLMGLALAAATIGSRYQEGLTHWGTTTLISVPPGFGAINFILKIMATTLVSSLAWRDIGR